MVSLPVGSLEMWCTILDKQEQQLHRGTKIEVDDEFELQFDMWCNMWWDQIRAYRL